MNTEFKLPAAMSASAIILQGDLYDRLERMAATMASGAVTVPKHLQGNKADCFAIAMQAAQWGMNPFLVAQKTHISQSGSLGYEAQLISAVINSSGRLESEPEYVFIGEWDRILGRIVEKEGKNGGKYFVPGWKAEDEAGLGVICRYKIRGVPMREMKVMLRQCWPRFSTQWTTDPQQQICYAAIKKVGRREFSEVIMGIYSPDELEEYPEIDITPPRETATPAANDSQEPAQEQEQKQEQEPPKYWPETSFARQFKKLEESIKHGRRTHQQCIDELLKRAPLTEEQIEKIKKIQAPIEGEATLVEEENNPE